MFIKLRCLKCEIKKMNPIENCFNGVQLRRSKNDNQPQTKEMHAASTYSVACLSQLFKFILINSNLLKLSQIKFN